MRNADFVMPAWIAGIQVREDASGNIHVSLDSSAPCWNDSRRAVLDVTEVAPPVIFEGAHEVHEGSDQKSLRNLRVLRAFHGESVSQNLLQQALRVIKKTRGIESR
jgi:hypothetical protein